MPSAKPKQVLHVTWALDVLKNTVGAGRAAAPHRRGAGVRGQPRRTERRAGGEDQGSQSQRRHRRKRRAATPPKQAKAVPEDYPGLPPPPAKVTIVLPGSSTQDVTVDVKSECHRLLRMYVEKAEGDKAVPSLYMCPMFQPLVELAEDLGLGDWVCRECGKPASGESAARKMFVRTLSRMPRCTVLRHGGFTVSLLFAVCYNMPLQRLLLRSKSVSRTLVTEMHSDTAKNAAMLPSVGEQRPSHWRWSWKTGGVPGAVDLAKAEPRASWRLSKEALRAVNDELSAQDRPEPRLPHVLADNISTAAVRGRGDADYDDSGYEEDLSVTPSDDAARRKSNSKRDTLNSTSSVLAKVAERLRAFKF